MKLTKGNRASLPNSRSTSSLPPSTLATGSSSVNLTSASSADVSDFQPTISPRHISAKGKGVERRYPPSSFSLSRALSFGVKRRNRKEVSESAVYQGDGTGAEDEDTDVGRRSGPAVPTPLLVPTSPTSDIHSPISPIPPLLPTLASSRESNDLRHSDIGVRWADTQQLNVGVCEAPSYAASSPELPILSSSFYSHPLNPISSTTSLSSQRSTTTLGPHFTSSSPKKLTKRRPVSIIHEDHESSSSSNRYQAEDRSRLSSTAYNNPQPYLPKDADQPIPWHTDRSANQTTNEPFLPKGAEPARVQSGLERNSSSSTATSSLYGPAPSTEESAVLQTPLDLSEGFSLSLHPYAQASDHLDHSVHQGDLSRSSTVSYRDGDDGASMSLRGFLVDEPAGYTIHPAKIVETALNRPPRPVSPSHSLAQSALTSLTGSSSSTIPAKSRPPLNVSRATTSMQAPRRSVTFDMPPETDAIPDPPILRLRSSSLGESSVTRTSVYSVGEVDFATTGIVTRAQSVDVSALGLASGPLGNNQPGPSQSELLIESLKSSSSAIRRAIDHEQQEYASRSSLSLRRPPPPPHLTRSSSTLHAQVLRDAGPVEMPTPSNHTSSPSKRPVGPSRSSSLGQLWRRISNPGSQRRGRSPGPNTQQEEPSRSATVPTPPKRTSSLFVGIPGVSIPELPSPVSPIDLKRLMRKASKGRLKMPRSPVSGNEENLPPLPVRSPVQSAAALPQTENNRRCVPSGLYIKRRNSSLVELPLAASPLVRSPLRQTSLGAQVDYSTSQHDAQSRPSLTFDSPDGTLRENAARDNDNEAKEKRRKYRQTLVEIKDDLVFHQVLEDLARLQTAAPTSTEQDPREDHVEIDMLEMRPRKGITRTPSKLISERKAREESIRAWFVTREIVQGERRHGRLLARGVATVRAASETVANEIPPLPSVNDHTTLQRRSKSSRSIRRRKLSLDERASSSLVKIEEAPKQPTSPLAILLEHLPRLLAVSLTLSSRFEHDPSPVGVAQAFGEMEEELSTEIGLWAGEVGNLIAMGFGSMMDRETPIHSRTASVSEMRVEEVDPDERLGFADIILMPITRALRYKLLFKELMEKIPNGSHQRIQVDMALRAADRLAAECDRKQGYDLEDLRRGVSIPGEKDRTKKKRPRSMGPSASSSAISGRPW